MVLSFPRIFNALDQLDIDEGGASFPLIPEAFTFAVQGSFIINLPSVINETKSSNHNDK